MNLQDENECQGCEEFVPTSMWEENEYMELVCPWCGWVQE